MTLSSNGLVESLRTHASLLITSSEMKATGRPIRATSLIVNSKRAAELVSGAEGGVALGAVANPDCMGLLSRSLIEKFITVLWGMRSIENAESQSTAGSAQLAKGHQDEPAARHRSDLLPDHG